MQISFWHFAVARSGKLCGVKFQTPTFIKQYSIACLLMTQSLNASLERRSHPRKGYSEQILARHRGEMGAFKAKRIRSLGQRHPGSRVPLLPLSSTLPARKDEMGKALAIDWAITLTGLKSADPFLCSPSPCSSPTDALSCSV